MKQLRIFETQAEYDSATIPLPNVCLVNKTLYYNKKIPFYVEAIEDLNVSYVGEYSRDRRKWTAFDSNSVSVQAGEKLYLRYTPTTYSSSSGTSRVYINDGKCNVGGNVMSLLYGSNYGDKTTLPFKNYDLAYLFKEQTNIVSAKDLKLPIRDLTGCNCCYYGMFSGCTILTAAPVLPATTLATYCYLSMFSNCTNINYIKMLATDISASGCLSLWVSGVSNSGTFVKHPNMNDLPTGASGIPKGWEVIDAEVIDD